MAPNSKPKSQLTRNNLAHAKALWPSAMLETYA